jgi:hypothetical protein
MGDLRIGITGHRWNRIDPALAPQLQALLRDALAQAEAQLPGTKRLVCGMAEGTDLVAALVRPEGWALEAVLPLPPEDWRRHLTKTARAQDAEDLDHALQGADVIVLPHPDGPDYTALAHHLADTCDILIAVWDKQAPKPGGSGEVVARAEARGIQVVILDPPGGSRPVPSDFP